MIFYNKPYMSEDRSLMCSVMVGNYEIFVGPKGWLNLAFVATHAYSDGTKVHDGMLPLNWTMVFN